LVGFDPLNNALLAVWGFLRTGFGVVPTATHGLVVVNGPATALEGAQWNMCVHAPHAPSLHSVLWVTAMPGPALSRRCAGGQCCTCCVPSSSLPQ
jgi:hypothetical protein